MSLGLGISLAIIATVSTNFGNNIQKWAFINKILIPNQYYKNKYWIIGLLLSVLGSICDLFALANAAQSVVGPLAAIGLVSNIFFSHYWLKETITKDHIISTFIIICGIIVIVIFGDHSSITYTIEDFKNYSQKPSSIIYMICVIAICYILIKKCDFLITIRESITKSNVNDSVVLDEHVIGRRQSLIRTYNEYRKVFPIYLSVLSGIIGGNSILFGKICAELVSTLIERNDTRIFSPFGFSSLVLLIFCVVYQQKYLAKGLEIFDISIIIPIFQCAFILTTIISGECFFGEFSNLDTISIILFIFGTCMTLFGIQYLNRNTIHEVFSTIEMHAYDDSEFNYEIISNDSASSVTAINTPTFYDSNSEMLDMILEE